MKFTTKCHIEKVCSKNETRVVLTNAYFDKDKARLIAANGISMAVIPVTVEENDTTGFVSPAALKEYRKQSKRYNVSIELNGSQKIGPVTFERPTAETCGTFPNVDQVIPKDATEHTTVIGLNAELLADLASALGSRDGVVTLKIKSAIDLIMVSTGYGDGLLMPVRV